MRASLLAGLVSCISIFAPVAAADSFAINEYSARDLGLANAGRVTQTGDAAAAFGNPALLTRYRRLTASGSLSGILGDAGFTEAGSTDAIGAPLGDDTDGFLKDALVPAFHGVYPLNDRTALGLSVTAPFGLATKYDSDWPGRYQALKSDLKTININPSIAWRLTDTLSIGAGVSAQYAKAELTSAIDFGAVCFAQLGPAQCATLGLTPQSTDGLTSIEGDDWSYGYNLGLAWQPHEDWLLGLHYRSNVDHELEGDATFIVPAAATPLTATGAFANTTGTAGLDLPASLEAGARYNMNDRITLYASALLMEWSSIDQLNVDFANPAQPDSSEVLNYEDAWRYSIGGEYQLNPQWMLRAGFALDESPTSEAFRTARIPDNDRQIYALGASWTPNEDWQMDVAYNRIEIDDTSFDRTGNFNDNLVGQYTGSANVISIGATRRF